MGDSEFLSPSFLPILYTGTAQYVFLYHSFLLPYVAISFFCLSFVRPSSIPSSFSSTSHPSAFFFLSHHYFLISFLLCFLPSSYLTVSSFLLKFFLLSNFPFFVHLLPFSCFSLLLFLILLFIFPPASPFLIPSFIACFLWLSIFSSNLLSLFLHFLLFFSFPYFFPSFLASFLVYVIPQHAVLHCIFLS